MKKIGITGGIGSGKSFVSKIIESFGYPVFYSDASAKRIISTNEYVREQLISFFGAKTFDGENLNKIYLAKIIFTNEDALQKVNNLIHPLVRKAFDQYALHQETKLVFNEAAILFESGGAEQFDEIILVTAPEEIRIRRVMERDNVSEEEVLLRIAKQWTDEKKKKFTRFVINNDEKVPLLLQVEKVLDLLSVDSKT